MLSNSSAPQGQRRGSNVRRNDQESKHVQPARARSWLFSPATLDRSLSRIDGLSEAEERRQRRSGCAHIQAIVRGVLEEPLRHAKLSDPTLASEASLESKMRAPAATAMVLFNRFYARHSFARHDRFLVAITCAFVGFKVEEMHQKVRHVINAGWDAWYAIGGGAGTGGPYATGTGPGTIGGGPLAPSQPSTGAHGQPLAKPRPEAQGAEFNTLRNAVLDTERILLYTLEFDLAVETPIPLVKELLLLLKDTNAMAPLGWHKTARNRDAPAEIIQGNTHAQNIAFAMCCSDLCLRFTPLELACAALELGFGLACASRSVTSPVTWQALRKVVSQAQYTADLVAKMGPAGSSSAAGGSGTPGGSSSSAGAALLTGNGMLGASGVGGTGQAGGASLSLAQAVRPLEEPIVREVLTRYEQYFTESIDDSSALLSNPQSDLRPAAALTGGAIPTGWLLASAAGSITGGAAVRQGVALSSFRSSYTPSPYTPCGAVSTPSEAAAGGMSGL